MADRPDAVVFDVLETLLNLDPLAACLEQKPGDVFLPADVTGDSLVEVADKLLTLH